jgi:pyridoxal phosphate enzyme (YggS family)
VLSAEQITSNYLAVQERIAEVCTRAGQKPAEMAIVGITKSHPAEIIKRALQAGIVNIGENRIQEAKAKLTEIGELRSAFRFHLVGHLQSNKVRLALTLFDLIHSLDSTHLASEIAHCHQLLEIDHPIPCLIEVNTSGEESKFGCAIEETGDLVAYCASLTGHNSQPAIAVQGLMTVGLWDADQERVRPCFVKLRRLAERIAEQKIPGVEMKELSMGMSGDYLTAVEEGATMVRLGTALFGAREQAGF